MLDGLNLVQRFGRHIWLIIGSIAGLLAIAASIFQENTFSMLEKVSKPLNLEEPIRSFNSWATSYDTNALAVVGAVLIFIGIYSSCRTIDENCLKYGPRTLSPGTAWIGYALMQPTGAAPITAVVLLTFICAALAITTDREEYEALNRTRFQHLLKQVGIAVGEILIGLAYVGFMLLLLTTLRTKHPSETTSNSK